MHVATAAVLLVPDIELGGARRWPAASAERGTFSYNKRGILSTVSNHGAS